MATRTTTRTTTTPGSAARARTLSPGGGRNVGGDGPRVPEPTESQRNETLEKLKRAREKIEADRKKAAEAEAAAAEDVAPSAGQTTEQHILNTPGATDEGGAEPSPWNDHSVERGTWSSAAAKNRWADKPKGEGDGGKNGGKDDRNDGEDDDNKLRALERQMQDMMSKMRELDNENRRLRKNRRGGGGGGGGDDGGDDGGNGDEGDSEDGRSGGDRDKFKETIEALNKRAKYRLGNLTARIPKLSDPDKDVAQRLVQIATWIRSTRNYFNATYYADGLRLFNHAAEAAKEFGRELFAAERRAGDGTPSLDDLEPPDEYSKDDDEYLRIVAALVEERCCDIVQTWGRLYSDDYIEKVDQGYRGFYQLVVVLVAARKEFDVASASHLDRLEAYCKFPKALTPSEFDEWWSIVGYLDELGHASWRHVGRGLLGLTDTWGRRLDLSRLDEHRLNQCLVVCDLDSMSVDKTQVVKAFQKMRAILGGAKVKKDTGTKPNQKARIAQILNELMPDDDGADGDEPSAFAAGRPTGGEPSEATNKGKGKGKGGKGGKGEDGCFKCGASDHWSRECPKPRPAYIAHDQDQQEWNEPAALNALDQERTASGQCWTCGDPTHQKHDCPEWLKRKAAAQGKAAKTGEQKGGKKGGRKGTFKARFLQALSAMVQELSSDEGEGDTSGNGPAPPPQ